MWHSLVVGGGLHGWSVWQEARSCPISDRASSEKDLAKTKPSSNAGGISVKTQLKSNIHCPTATRERSEEKVQTKQPCRHWGLWWRRGRCAPGAGADSPAAHGEGRVQVGCSLQQRPVPWRKLQPMPSCSWRTGATREQFLWAYMPWEGAHAGAVEERQWKSVMTITPRSPCSIYEEGVEEWKSEVEPGEHRWSGEGVFISYFPPVFLNLKID